MRKKLLGLVLVVTVALIGLRLALPSILLNAINKQLDQKLENYRGHIEDFDLSLYRGAYQVENLTIKKRGVEQEPFLKIDHLDISISWKALFRGHVAADVIANGLDMQYIDSKDEKKKQLGQDEKGWEAAYKTVIPVKIHSLVVENSKVNFTYKTNDKEFPVELSQIHFEMSDLTFNHGTPDVSPLHGSAVLQNHAKVEVQGKANFFAKPMVMDLDFSLEKFDVKTLNHILRMYIPLDLTKGVLEIYGELASLRGTSKGYSKIFLKDGDIIASPQKFLNVKHFFYEFIAAVGNWFLQNPKTDKAATKIEITGKDGDLQFDADHALETSLANKKHQLKPAIDHTVDLHTVGDKSE